MGGAAIRRYDSVGLGEDLQHLKKLTKVLVERLAWLEEHRRFAGSQSARKMDEVRNYLQQRTKNTLIHNILAVVDADPVSKSSLGLYMYIYIYI